MVTVVAADEYVGTYIYLQGIIPWATNWLMGLLNINLTLRAENKNARLLIVFRIKITTRGTVGTINNIFNNNKIIVYPCNTRSRCLTVRKLSGVV